MERDLLIEIGTEEIPSSFLEPAQTRMRELMLAMLERERISCDKIETYGTPRRLALLVRNISERQKNRINRQIGPPRHIAFDKSGSATKAAIAFAQKNRARLEDLTIETTEKGDYLALVSQECGGESKAVLQETLPIFIKQIPFPKTMRWADKDIRFARPIHWILALFGEEVIPFEVDGIKSANMSKGHRFMSAGEFPVKDFHDYMVKTDDHKVIVDQVRRKELIKQQLKALAESIGGRVYQDEELLDIVTNLIEYPFSICGSFEPIFLELPKAVLVMVMREHQRFFPVEGESGELLPNFMAVSNTRPRNAETVRIGNERVLRARLADAKFFFDEDQKKSLNKSVENLKNVVFITELGTFYEKVSRIRSLAEYLIGRLNPDKKAAVQRAAFLCKADLVSQMVYEFPKLQGIMGREYASRTGELPEVSRAIYEHYLPRFSGDDLPECLEGSVIAIADRIDTITGCFGIGLMPTGSEDPYALRRQALGIIQIILGKSLRIPLQEIMDRAINELKDKINRKPAEVLEDVRLFFRARVQNLFLSQGYPYDLIEAVLTGELEDLVITKKKLEALVKFRERTDFKTLMVGFKRVINILRNHEAAPLDPGLLKEDAEKNLYSSYVQVREHAARSTAQEDFLEALQAMSKLKPAIDRLFDEVMVMVEDDKIRGNRLALLWLITAIFSSIGDFSKVQID